MELPIVRTGSDVLEAIAAVPGIEIGTEVNLSDRSAQRFHDRVQRKLDELD